MTRSVLPDPGKIVTRRSSRNHDASAACGVEVIDQLLQRRGVLQLEVAARHHMWEVLGHEVGQLLVDFPRCAQPL